MIERYRTLTIYGCFYEDKELADAKALPDQWKALKDEALTKESELHQEGLSSVPDEDERSLKSILSAFSPERGG